MSHDTDMDSDASLLSDVEPGWSLVDREGEVEVRYRIQINILSLALSLAHSQQL